MAEYLSRYTIDKSISGNSPDSPPVYIAMCHLFCDSIEAFQHGFGPHAETIFADIANYTHIELVIQISEVVGRG